MSLIFLASLLRMMMTLWGVVSWGLPELGAAGRVRCHITPAAVSTLRTWEEAGTPPGLSASSHTQEPSSIGSCSKDLFLFVFGLSLEVGMDKKHMER